MEWAKTYWTYAKTVFETLRDKRQKEDGKFLYLDDNLFICLYNHPTISSIKLSIMPTLQPTMHQDGGCYLSISWLPHHTYFLSLWCKSG